MGAVTHFAESYADARDKFRAIAGRKDGKLRAAHNPALGLHGEELSIDYAWFGASDAPKVLVLFSGTHGAEGFCGSGCQIGWLAEVGPETLPNDMALFVIHGVNPYGFSWLRRTNEDNVDLNRNFVDFSKSLPENKGYDQLAAAICPKEWSGASRTAADQELAAYAKTHGDFALQSAMSIGQYRHPKGLFYGGLKPTWSRRTLEDLARRYLSSARHIALIDYHTGLGPYGHGELIATGAKDNPGYLRCKEWYGADNVTNPDLGNSASAQVIGTMMQGLEKVLPQAVATSIAIEYGTKPVADVVEALRADAWLHVHGDISSVEGRKIKQAVRDAFYGDEPIWKEKVRGQSDQVIARAVAGLAAS